MLHHRVCPLHFFWSWLGPGKNLVRMIMSWTLQSDFPVCLQCWIWKAASYCKSCHLNMLTQNLLPADFPAIPGTFLHPTHHRQAKPMPDAPATWQGPPDHCAQKWDRFYQRAWVAVCRSFMNHWPPMFSKTGWQDDWPCLTLMDKQRMRI